MCRRTGHDYCTQCITTPQLLSQRAFTIFLYTFCVQIALSIAFILEVGTCSLVQDGQAEKQRDICPSPHGSFSKLERLPQTTPEQTCWLGLLLSPTSDSYTGSTALKMKEEGFSSTSDNSPSPWPLAFVAGVGLWVGVSHGGDGAGGLQVPFRKLPDTCWRWPRVPGSGEERDDGVQPIPRRPVEAPAQGNTACSSSTGDEHIQGVVWQWIPQGNGGQRAKDCAVQSNPVQKQKWSKIK